MIILHERFCAPCTVLTWCTTYNVDEYKERETHHDCFDQTLHLVSSVTVLACREKIRVLLCRSTVDVSCIHELLINSHLALHRSFRWTTLSQCSKTVHIWILYHTNNRCLLLSQCRYSCVRTCHFFTENRCEGFCMPLTIMRPAVKMNSGPIRLAWTMANWLKTDFPCTSCTYTQASWDHWVMEHSIVLPHYLVWDWRSRQYTCTPTNIHNIFHMCMCMCIYQHPLSAVPIPTCTSVTGRTTMRGSTLYNVYTRPTVYKFRPSIL